MRTIVIDEEVNTSEDVTYLLEEILSQLKNGNTSGVNPNWSLEGEDEEGENDEE